MTPNDLKRLDKKIRQLSDPFGSGFPILRKILTETAQKNRIAVTTLALEYIGWKWKK